MIREIRPHLSIKRGLLTKLIIVLESHSNITHQAHKKFEGNLNLIWQKQSPDASKLQYL